MTKLYRAGDWIVIAQSQGKEAVVRALEDPPRYSLVRYKRHAEPHEIEQAVKRQEAQAEAHRQYQERREAPEYQDAASILSSDEETLIAAFGQDLLRDLAAKLREGKP